MGIVDILILVIIIVFAIVGFKRGAIESLVTIIGFFAVIYLAYLLKNYLGDFLVLNSPFTKFTIIPSGSYVLNIVMYESIAFIIMLVVLGIIYKVLLIMSGILEKLLKITIVLGIPSKIIGLIIGAIEGYIIVYFILFLLSQPYIGFNLFQDSNYSETILRNTPVLSSFAEDTFTVIDEINETVKGGDNENFDLKLTDLVLKRKITSAEVMQELIDKKKLSVNGIQEVVDNYKTEETSEE